MDKYQRYHLKHRDKILARKKAFRLKNKDKLNKEDQDFYYANRERILKRRKELRDKKALDKNIDDIFKSLYFK